MPILAPFEAFARDAELLNAQEDESRLPVRWLAAAQVAARFADSPRERKTLLRAWADHQKKNDTESVWCALAVNGITITDIASAAATLCRIAEEMQSGGAFNLAYATVTNMRIAMLERGPAAARGHAALHQARVLGRMGLLEEAKDTFEEAYEDGVRAHDRELEGRALQGLSVVAGQRGNFPDVVSYGHKALALLDRNSPYASVVHGNLMIAAQRTNDFATAFEHGWCAYDTAADVEQRARITTTLSNIALQLGKFAAARRGFLAVLSTSTLERMQVPALGSLALTAAGVGDMQELARVSEMLDRASATATLHYEFAQTRFELAQAWKQVGHLEKAAQYLTRARDIAAAHGFHEVSFRSELLAESIERAKTSTPDARIDAAISRFDAIPVDLGVTAHV